MTDRVEKCGNCGEFITQCACHLIGADKEWPPTDRVEEIRAIGGMTNSIFPQVEALLLADTEHLKALMYVAARKRVSRYESVMDFLFCEIFYSFRHKCSRFYEGKGPQLRHLVSPGELSEFNEVLLRALEVALRMYGEGARVSSWTSFRFEVMNPDSESA